MRAEQVLESVAIEKNGSGVMVALYVPMDTARWLSVKNGEPPDDLHVTLAYVPGVGGNEDALNAIAQAVSSVAESCGPIEGRIGGTGRFNGSETSDWLDVFYASFDSPYLLELVDEVREAIRETGFEVSDKHGFTPHITLRYLDYEEGTPNKRCDSFIKVPCLSVASRSFRIDLPFEGVSKGQPTGSQVHVKAPGEEGDEEEDQTTAAAPTAQEPGSMFPPAQNEEVGFTDSVVLAALNKDKLTTEGRKHIDSSNFALPKERRYPIHDISHARNALARASGKPEEARVRAAVYRKYPSLKNGVDKSSAMEVALVALGGDLSKEWLPIRKLNAPKQILYCVVLEPGTEDLQGDILTEDEIEKACHEYMQESRTVGRRHQGPLDASVVENFIAPTDMHWTGGPYGDQHVVKGSWVIGIKVRDPEEWKRVESGEYTGVSIGGTGTRVPL